MDSSELSRASNSFSLWSLWWHFTSQTFQGLSFEMHIKGDKTDSYLVGKKYSKWNSDRK